MKNENALPWVTPYDGLDFFDNRGDGPTAGLEGFEYVVDFNRGFWDITPVYNDQSSEAFGIGFRSGDVLFTSTQMKNVRSYKNTATHKKDEFLEIETIVSGSYEVTEQGLNRMFKNEVYVGCNAMDTEEFCHEGSFAALRAPIDLLGFDPYHHGELEFSFADPRGRILNVALGDLFIRLPHLARAEGAQAMDDMLGLVRDIVLRGRREVNRAVLNRARRLAVDAYIEDALPRVPSTEELCVGFAMSRATLFRMYQKDGGLTAFISNRRLSRCLDLLRTAPAKRGAVRRVAERFGYYESSNFNRVFKTRFGYPPTEALGLALEGAPVPQEPEIRSA